MNQKELGKTGVLLPEIGLGTWQYRAGLEPIQKAVDLGVSIIDTAESYGTEQIVGEAVKHHRNRVFIATKISPRHFRRSDVLMAADKSLERLRTDYIDLYQLHWPNHTVPIEETVGAMEDLVDRGKIRFIGVSNFSVAELRKAQKALSKYRLVSNQVRYSLVDRSVELCLLRYCRENAITVIAFSPLGHGINRIKEKDPDSVLHRVAAMACKTEAQVALNWCISGENVIAIPKASSVDHVVQNCGASGWRLAPDLHRLLEEGVKFRRRGRAEATLQRAARAILQSLGRNQ
jgi:diketogulonate reductase-like aldo/keto reductase